MTMLLTLTQLQAIQDRVDALPEQVTAQLTHSVPNTPGRVGHIELTSVVLAVLAERARQRAIWGDTHDDEAHDEGELGAAAAVLALPPGAVEWLNGAAPHWAVKMRRKLTDNRYGALVRAAALLISELERLHRAQSGQTFTELQRLEGADDGQKFAAGHPLTEFLAHAPSDIAGLLEHLKAVDEAYLGGRPDPAAWCPACNVVVASVDREGLCHCGSNIVMCESLGDAAMAVELLGVERAERGADNLSGQLEDAKAEIERLKLHHTERAGEFMAFMQKFGAIVSAHPLSGADGVLESAQAQRAIVHGVLKVLQPDLRGGVSDLPQRVQALNDRLSAAAIEIKRLDGVVSPDIMGDVLCNLRRILEHSTTYTAEQIKVIMSDPEQAKVHKAAIRVQLGLPAEPSQRTFDPSRLGKQ